MTPWGDVAQEETHNRQALLSPPPFMRHTLVSGMARGVIWSYRLHSGSCTCWCHASAKFVALTAARHGSWVLYCRPFTVST